MATWQQSDLDNLSKAIASGVLEVRFADRVVRYNSIRDLLEAQSVIQAYLQTQSGAVRIRQHLIIPGTGF